MQFPKLVDPSLLPLAFSGLVFLAIWFWMAKTLHSFTKEAQRKQRITYEDVVKTLLQLLISSLSWSALVCFENPPIISPDPDELLFALSEIAVYPAIVFTGFLFTAFHIMRQTNPPMHASLRRGGLLALVAACIGSTLFTLVDQVQYLYQIEYTVMKLLFACLFSALPAMLGGGFLAYWLHRDALRGHLSTKMAVLKGAVIGAVTGLGLCLAGWILMHGRGSWDLFLWRTFKVTVIATLASSWTAWKLAARMPAQIIQLEGRG
ncbi:MAG: hypothetical protein AB1894_28875 [Chloroflexota bacterium]